MKTTSPDRFRVRPNSGLLQQGVSTKITVVLQNGYQVQSILKDKFLLMSMASDREEVSQQEIAELWKVIQLASPSYYILLFPTLKA